MITFYKSLSQELDIISPLNPVNMPLPDFIISSRFNVIDDEYDPQLINLILKIYKIYKI